MDGTSCRGRSENDPRALTRQQPKYANVTAYERTRERTKTNRLEPLAGGGDVPKTVYTDQAEI